MPAPYAGFMDKETLRTPKTEAELQLQREIGARLRKARLGAGMTMEQAGEIINISKAAMGHWEHGLRAMDVVKIAALIKAYSVTSDSVLIGGPTKAMTREAQALGREFDQLPLDDKKFIRETIQDRLVRARAAQSKAS